MKKSLVFKMAAVTAAALLTLSACSSDGNNGDNNNGGDPTTAPVEMVDVKFQLDTSVLPKHSIFFAALGKGFYEEAGLRVEILPSQGSLVTSQAVGAKSADFGFADAATMTGARSNGAMVKQLASIHSQSPFSVVSLEENGINSFDDLKGKLVAGEPAGSTTVLFPIALELAGMSLADLAGGDTIAVDPTAKIPGLLNGDWDATLGYSVSDPPVMIGLGAKPTALLWSSVGFELYANGLIAHDDTIANNPELVERFVEATLKGVKWACDNLDAAAENQVELVPEIDLTAARVGVEMACDIIWTPEGEENGLGYFSEAGWENLVSIAGEFLGLDASSLDIHDLYTNEFNPGIKPSDTIALP